MSDQIPEQIVAMAALEPRAKVQDCSYPLKPLAKFAAEKNIKPIIETFTHKTANDAIQKIRDGSIRFRAVLKNDLI